MICRKRHCCWVFQMYFQGLWAPQVAGHRVPLYWSEVGPLYSWYLQNSATRTIQSRLTYSSTRRRQNFDFWVCRWTSLLNLERVCTVCWDQSCHSWTEWSTSPDSTAVSERAARCLHEAFQLRLKACWNISPLLKSTSGSAMEFSLFLPAACVTSAAIRYEVKFM